MVRRGVGPERERERDGDGWRGGSSLVYGVHGRRDMRSKQAIKKKNDYKNGGGMEPRYFHLRQPVQERYMNIAFSQIKQDPFWDSQFGCYEE